MAESTLSAKRSRDARIIGLVATVILVVGGGYFLDRWINQGDRPDLQAHVDQKRNEEIDARFKQGVVMLHAKQFEHATTAFHRVLQLAPTMPEAHVNMGFAMLGQKRYKEALEFFDGATALNRNQLNAYYGMAEAYEGLGDFRGALESMEAWLHRAKPDDPFRRRGEAAVWEWRDRLTRDARTKSAPK
ncbi:MAG: tetratricopeptide repeat protein [Sulfuritalea sp.]|nr:tetratricopeptide repeat protein [Sulfuritalea sp.]